MTQNIRKSGPVEVVVSAAEAVQAAAMVAAPTLDNDATVYLHLVPDGIWTMRTARGKAAATKPIVLEPSGPVTHRFTVTASVARAYITATDATARAAIIAATGVTPLVSPAPDAADGATPSNLTPEAERVFGWLDLSTEVEPLPEAPEAGYISLARRLMAEGIAAIPAKAREVKVKAVKVKADTTDATLAGLFARRA